MPQSIEIDDDVFGALQRQAEPLIDTPNSVLRRLLLLDESNDEPSASDPADTPVRPARAGRSNGRSSRASKSKAKGARAARGTLLPESEYEIPILRYLAAHDGRAPSREVIDAIGQDLAAKLTDADKESLNSGEIRWKSRAAFVRLRLVERGELNGKAPRGTWEITAKGEARVKSAA
jgi:Mrr N-terminal domain